jgi:hypothetical protein
MNNLTHWGTGKMWGAPYGLATGSVAAPRAWFGPALGTIAWGTSYVVMPLAKLYEPIWKYEPKVLAKEYGAHLVYGVTTAVAFRILAGGRTRAVRGAEAGP